MPPRCLSRLIATLHDDEGSVAIDGLVGRDEADVDLTEAEYRADASVLDGVQLAGSGTHCVPAVDQAGPVHHRLRRSRR